MTKTYKTPALVTKGDVTAITRNTSRVGIGDPLDGVEFQYMPSGGVGFGL